MRQPTFPDTTITRFILSLLVVTVLLVVSISPFSPPAVAGEGTESNISQIEPVSKGNPKLDSRLNRLIPTATMSEAVPFSQGHAPESSDTVRLIVEGVPGQVAQTSSDVG